MSESGNMGAELDEVARRFFDRDTAAWNEKAAERSLVQQGGANEGYASVGGGACAMVCAGVQTCSLCGQTCSLCTMLQTCSLCGQTCSLCGQTCSLCGQTCSLCAMLQTCSLCGQTCSLCGQTCSACNACAACSGTGHHHPLKVILVKEEDPPQRFDVGHDEQYWEHGRT